MTSPEPDLDRLSSIFLDAEMEADARGEVRRGVRAGLTAVLGDLGLIPPAPPYQVLPGAFGWSLRETSTGRSLVFLSESFAREYAADLQVGRRTWPDFVPSTDPPVGLSSD
ncbi:hypothetical protein N1031_06825 [Herbiconiux moechotypicola]|uniref:Uncharacterized protein n=1 Tax=Herbiconiux moechotypicola TaxID=637393 RepID=A0ABP5QDB1_9MICO|nr:hypothetical protein [Herbiconiux moechotypicola]MCS5729471.1 hypothetical protein [Herbiconiux moechotypicola]